VVPSAASLAVAATEVAVAATTAGGTADRRTPDAASSPAAQAAVNAAERASCSQLSVLPCIIAHESRPGHAVFIIRVDALRAKDVSGSESC